MFIVIISLIGLIISMNTNHAFANNDEVDSNYKDKDIENFHQDKYDDKAVEQNNYQNNQCKDGANCDNKSVEQLNNQNIFCKDDANCVNESTSNIVVCEEGALCLVQYNGPFELVSPY